MPVKKKRSSPAPRPVVGIIMGSISDRETLRHAAEMLESLDVCYEWKVVSAHRTPGLLYEYAATAESRGLRCIIAGAGGAAHLPGMTASMTVLPVLGVPVESRALKGVDSLLSIVQMPGGVPVATFAIGKAGATNAAHFAVSLLAAGNPSIARRLKKFRANQTAEVLATQSQLDEPDFDEGIPF
jgi:5-(carboxyamino)imidazole ribonucleotide mutase